MSKEVALKAENSGVSVNAARWSEQQIAASNINNVSQLPELKSENKHFMPLSIEYWTPTVEGEEKMVYIIGIGNNDVPDMETGEIKTLECVQMVESQGGTLVRFISASKVLVGNIRDAITRGDIVPATTLTPVSIKFLGQKKNKSNAKLSNRWQISPIITG